MRSEFPTGICPELLKTIGAGKCDKCLQMSAADLVSDVALCSQTLTCGWLCCQPDGTLDALLSNTATLSSILAALCGLQQPQEPDAEIRERLADSILLLVRLLTSSVALVIV